MSYTSNYNLNQRISYLESIIQQIVPSLPLALDNILANGNSAGTFDIDLNGNDLLNVNEVDVLSNTPIVSIVDASLPTKFINLDGSVPNITITDGINTNVITPLGSGGTTTNTQNVETTSVSNNQSYYPTFVGADNGFNPIRVDTQLRYNPSTDTLSVPNITLTNINGSAYPPVVPADTLSAVLTAGNSAGGLDITNLDNLGVNTINGSAYPPVVPADTLSAVLLAGNSAGATDINLNFNDIQNANEIDFVSGANTASLQFDPLAPANFEIVCSGDLELRPVGSIDCNGATIDLTNGRIIKCDDIESPNNIDLNIICNGTADFIVQTNSVNRLTISDSGVATFSTLPECSVVPTTSNQLVNKAFVDSLEHDGEFDDFTAADGSAFNWNFTGTGTASFFNGTFDAAYASVGNRRIGLLNLATAATGGSNSFAQSSNAVYSPNNISSLTFGFIPLGNGSLSTAGTDAGNIYQAFGIAQGTSSTSAQAVATLWRISSGGAGIPTWTLVENNVIKETLSGANLTGGLTGKWCRASIFFTNNGANYYGVFTNLTDGVSYTTATYATTAGNITDLQQIYLHSGTANNTAKQIAFDYLDCNTNALPIGTTNLATTSR